MATINDVRNYWQENPLLSYELKDVGSENFFEQLDKTKREDVEKFSLSFWEFEYFKNKKVLDVGCGPGWYSLNYALEGATVYAIDLTSRAIELTRKNFSYNNLKAQIEEGNAENLQFNDNYFDLVVSSGVLHHTSNTVKAIQECFRVTKPGSKAKITLYHKNFLHNRFAFFLIKKIMKLLKLKHPGADLASAKNVDEFIRQYDGTLNPIGKAERIRDWVKILKKTGFIVNNHQIHYFPKRLFPFNRVIPVFIHRFLDKYFGLMVYFDLVKPLV